MASSKTGSYTLPERSEGSNTVPEKSEGPYTVPERSEDTHTTPERSVSSHTGPSSSFKSYDHLCGPCSMDGVDKEAKHYCQSCGQKYVTHAKTIMENWRRPGTILLVLLTRLQPQLAGNRETRMFKTIMRQRRLVSGKKLCY